MNAQSNNIVYFQDHDGKYKLGKITGYGLYDDIESENYDWNNIKLEDIESLYLEFGEEGHKKEGLFSIDKIKIIDDEKFKIIKELPQFFSKDINEIEIDEYIFNEKTCNDIITFEDIKNIDYLNEDEKENILIIMKKSNNDFVIDCFKRDYIREILKDDTKCRLMCELYNSNDGSKLLDPLNVQGFANPKYQFYKIDTTFGSFYLSKEDVTKMLKLGNRIFYINQENPLKIPRTASLDVYKGRSVVSADHCQQGTNILVYSLDICGGAKCLQRIFIEYDFEED